MKLMKNRNFIFNHTFYPQKYYLLVLFFILLPILFSQKIQAENNLPPLGALFICDPYCEFKEFVTDKNKAESLQESQTSQNSQSAQNSPSLQTSQTLQNSQSSQKNKNLFYLSSDRPAFKKMFPEKIPSEVKMPLEAKVPSEVKTTLEAKTPSSPSTTTKITPKRIKNPRYLFHIALHKEQMSASYLDQSSSFPLTSYYLGMGWNPKLNWQIFHTKPLHQITLSQERSITNTPLRLVDTQLSYKVQFSKSKLKPSLNLSFLQKKINIEQSGQDAYEYQRQMFLVGGGFSWHSWEFHAQANIFNSLGDSLLNHHGLFDKFYFSTHLDYRFNYSFIPGQFLLDLEYISNSETTDIAPTYLTPESQTKVQFNELKLGLIYEIKF